MSNSIPNGQAPYTEVNNQYPPSPENRAPSTKRSHDGSGPSQDSTPPNQKPKDWGSGYPTKSVIAPSNPPYKPTK